MYAGGCTLNDAFDEQFDRRHNPDRPLPSGQISQRAVWSLGFVELGAGGLLLTLGADCSSLWTLLLLGTVLAYDYLHKTWQGGFILMGGCRLFLWLAAATAGELNEISSSNLALGLTLLPHAMGISMYAKGESQKREAPARVSIVFLFLSFARLGRLDPLASDRSDSPDLDQLDRAFCSVDCLPFDHGDEEWSRRCHR